MFRWYAIHTYSGHEDKVRRNLEQRRRTQQGGEGLRRIVVPTEHTVETRDGKKVEKESRVLPGYVLTDPWRKRTQDLATAEGLSFETALVEVLKRQDMGHSRWGTPGEIADVVLFLLSAQAAFVNGAAFRVDGGQFLAIQN